MLFWTIILFIVNAAMLKSDNFIMKMYKGINEIKLEQLENTLSDEDKKEHATKLLISFVVAAFILITTYIYIFSAIKVDPYLYPTLAMLAYHVLSWIKLKSPKNLEKMNEKELEEFKLKTDLLTKFGFGKFLKALFETSYFAYMIYVLLFLVG